MMYERLAVKRNKENYESLFTFWDKKCLNYGQDWEQGFVHGIMNAQVISLLVSNSVISFSVIVLVYKK